MNFPQDFVNRWKLNFPNNFNEIMRFNREGIHRTIRANTIKTNSETLLEILKNRHLNVYPVNEIPNAIVVRGESKALGSTHEYLKGHYAIQGLAGQLAVLLFDFLPFLSGATTKKARLLD